MIDLYATLELGKAWSDLGWAVQEQLEAFITEPDIDALVERGELNTNCLDMFVDYLRTADAFGCDEAQSFIHDIEVWQRIQRDQLAGEEQS